MVNNERAAEKVADVLTNVFVVELFGSHSLALRNLAIKTFEWIEKQTDILSDKIKATYKEWPREELLLLSPARYIAPSAEDLFKRR